MIRPNLILATMAMMIAAIPALAVGTVNQSLAQIPGSTNYVFTENWTGDSITGSVPATTMLGATAIQGFRIVSVETAPGSPAPTNLYTVTLTDFSGADILGGSGASQSNTTATILPSISNSPPIYGSLTVNVTGNSVASAKGSVLVYFAPVSQVFGNTPVGAGLTGNNLFTGTNTFNGSSTFSGATTVTGLLSCKNFENVPCVDAANVQGWGGNNYGAWVNSAIASLPTVNSHPVGTIYLFAGATTTPNVQIPVSTTINYDPFYLNLTGAGPDSVYLQCSAIPCINYSLNGTWVAAGLEGELSGITLNGNAVNSMVGLQFTGINHHKIRNVHLTGFTGTNSYPMLFSNSANQFSELMMFDKVQVENSNVCLRIQDLNSNTGSSADYDFWTMYEFRCTVNAGGTGIDIENDAHANAGQWRLMINPTGTGITAMLLNGTSSFSGHQLEFFVDDSGFSTGTFWNVAAGAKAVNNHGIIEKFYNSGAWSNSISGTFDFDGAFVSSVPGINTASGHHSLTVGTPATAGANFNSPISYQCGQIWNGSVTTQDCWQSQTLYVAGTNPVTRYDLSHTGSSGNSAVSTPSIANLGTLYLGTNTPGGVSGAVGFANNPGTTVAGISGTLFGCVNPTVAWLCEMDLSGNWGIAGGVRTVTSIAPSVAGAADVGTAALPYGNAWLGTAATNNFKVQPGTTTGARVITITDPVSPTTVGLPLTIATGTATLTTAAITAPACGTTVTVAAAGVAATDSIYWSFNAAPAGTNAGLVSWPTAGNVNFAYCPGVTETPAAATANWRVVR